MHSERNARPSTDTKSFEPLCSQVGPTKAKGTIPREGTGSMERFSGVVAVGAIAAAIVTVANGVLLYLSVRDRRSKAATIGCAAVMAGAACMMLYYLSSADSTRLAFSLAGAILFITGLVAILIARRHLKR